MSTVLARHARCYLTYAQENPDDWGWFDREWPQIERAWCWLIKQSDAPVLLVEFACAFLYQQEQQGRWRTLLAWGEAALRAARALGDQAGEAFILSRLGMAQHNLGNLAQALVYHEQGLALARAVGDQDLAVYWQRRVVYDQAVGHSALAQHCARLAEVRRLATAGSVDLLTHRL